jgi:hypothetical protein
MKKLSMIGIVGGAALLAAVASGPCGATANGVTR